MKLYLYIALAVSWFVHAAPLEERVQAHPKKAAGILEYYEGIGQSVQELLEQLVECPELDMSCYVRHHSQIIAICGELEKTCQAEKDFYGHEYDAVSCKALKGLKLLFAESIKRRLVGDLTGEDVKRERDIYVGF